MLFRFLDWFFSGRSPRPLARTVTTFSANLKACANRPTTVSVLILVDSGSMASKYPVPQDVVNKFLDTLRADHRTRHVAGLVIYDGIFRVEIPISQVRLMPPYSGYSGHVTESDRQLYRTVMRVLQALMDSWDYLSTDERNNLTINVFVVSGGEDTSPPKHNFQAALVEYTIAARRRDWNLHCYGLDVNGSDIARKMGFDPLLAGTFTADSGGIELMIRRAGTMAIRRA